MVTQSTKSPETIEKVKKSIAETKLRRKNQIPVVFQLKIVKQNKAWFRQAKKSYPLQGIGRMSIKKSLTSREWR